MSIEKTLYLHIGLPKTGTTSIQSYLFDHSEVLMERGLYYPTPLVDFGHHAEALLFLRQNHPEFNFRWHRQATEAADRNHGELSRLVAIFDSRLSELRTEERRLILSSEGILEAFQAEDDIDIFRRFFSDYTIKVIIYIRRIDKMVSSAIMEHVKVYEPISQQVIERNKDFRVKQQLKILEMLQYWEAMIGRENVIIRPFEKGQLKDNDVVADFMAIIDPTYEVDCEVRREQNLSISLECAYFMGQTLTYPAWERTPLEAIIASVIASSQKLRQISQCKGSLISPETSVELIEKLNPIYEEIAKRYLGSAKTKLFQEPLPDLIEQWEPFSGLTYQNAKPIYDEIINILYRRLEKLQKVQQENNQVVELRNELTLSRETLEVMRQTWSWKLTRPLRVVSLFFKNNKEFWRLLNSKLNRK